MWYPNNTKTRFVSKTTYYTMYLIFLLSVWFTLYAENYGYLTITSTLYLKKQINNTFLNAYKVIIINTVHIVIH